MKTVVLDKTGTITKGEPEITDMLCASGVEANELLRVAAALEKKSEHRLAAQLFRVRKVWLFAPTRRANFAKFPAVASRACMTEPCA